MTINAKTVDEYISKVPDERTATITKLRETIKTNLPKGFEEGINYKMIGFYVPHSLYPHGYHCDPKLPLPFINIASQKNFIALYHSGIYADKKLYDWFVAEYPKYVKTKLDMGKSCIRFKKTENIPYDLIAKLCQKMTVDNWIALYEKNVKR
jgi:uncharacterized protein YdhG (YjbR/CyaY superfamily)